MSDTQKSCLGFTFLIAAMVLAVLALIGGWLGWDFRSGAILAMGTFAFFFVLAVYTFLKVRDYSWFPAILAGAYTVLPDLIAGSTDDIAALLVGAALSGLLAWRRGKRDGKEALD